MKDIRLADEIPMGELANATRKGPMAIDAACLMPICLCNSICENREYLCCHHFDVRFSPRIESMGRKCDATWLRSIPYLFDHNFYSDC